MTGPPVVDDSRWQVVLKLARGWTASGELPAVGLCIGTAESTLPPALFGRQTLNPETPIRDDAVFLVASITKPIVAMAAVLLVERGKLRLGDRVCDHIAEFGRKGRYGITVRHLLTHTSGLPDMLPNNRQLRMAHAPLLSFIEDTCEADMAFQPGRAVQYQSMGFLLLGEIIRRVDGRDCRTFVRQEFFEPLGMLDTELGAPDGWFEGASPNAERIAEVRLPAEQSLGDDWTWNSRYWRSLGAPWGGLLTTPADLARFARMMLRGGELDGARVLSTAAVDAATRNQLQHMKHAPEDDRRCRPWGLGWRLNWPEHSANFGDLLSPHTYGHWGATGTVLWIDPDRNAFAVVLTTQPQEPHGTYISRLSNAIAAAML